MIRKLASLALVLMLLCVSASAMEIEAVQRDLPTDTTGAQMALYRACMDNGQEIYFLSDEPEGAHVISLRRFMSISRKMIITNTRRSGTVSYATMSLTWSVNGSFHR